MADTPLILIHGYPFDHTMWSRVVAALPARIRPITLDLPGFGKEPAPAIEPNLDVMAEHVVRVLDREKIPRAVLGGFSMGGYVALAVAEHAPQHLAGLALINSQPFADTDEVRSGRRTIIEKVRREGVEAASKAALGKMFTPGKEVSEELAAIPIRGAAQAGLEGITWALEAMARRPDRTEILRKLNVPLLIVHTAGDQFIPIQRIRDLAKNLPAARYTEIPDAGHATPLETPDAVAGALADFMESVE